MSGSGVLKALQSKGVDAHAFDPAERDLSELKRKGFKRCFIALHGRFGEDGTVQGALELLGIPYTGSGVMASSIAIDKVMTKRVWLAEGLPTPRYALLRRGSYDREQVHRRARRAGPAADRQAGARGLVHRRRQGAGLLRDGRRGGRRRPRSTPTCCASSSSAATKSPARCWARATARVALPVIRIVAPEGNYDYQNKYFTDDTKYLVPCGLPEGEEQAIQDIVLKAYRVLGCRGWGRVDVMIDAATRKPYLLEINTSPGMTGHSLVPMSARAAGISYEDLCLQLLASAALDQREGAGNEMSTPGHARAVRRQADEHHRHGAVRRLCVVLLLAAGVVVGAAPAALRASAASRCRATSRTTAPSTLRANVAPRLAGNFFTVNLAGARAGLRGGALGAPGRGAARVPEPAARAAAGAPGRRAVGQRCRVAAGQQLRRGVRGQRRRCRAGRAAAAGGPGRPVGAGAGHVPRRSSRCSSRWT